MKILKTVMTVLVLLVSLNIGNAMASNEWKFGHDVESKHTYNYAITENSNGNSLGMYCYHQSGNCV